MQRKSAFQGYKNKTLKKSKNWHFSKRVNPWFWSKNGHFFNIFFSQYRQGKCLIRYSRTKKRLSRLWKQEVQKWKNWHISKGDNSWFWSKKGPFFQLLFLGTIGQENVFYDILERKNTFLGYKNKKFKKSKNWHISKGGNSWFWSKNGHFSNDTIRIEYREERLVFFLQSHQTSFVGQNCLKRKNKPIWNFWPKPWTNPFGKIQILRLFYIDVFTVKKG